MAKQMDYVVRKCQLTDIEKIVSIEDKWTPGIRSIFCEYDPNGNAVEQCYVAEKDGIIGFIYGFVLPHGILIPHFLYVVEPYRGFGIAKKLLHTLEMETSCHTSQINYERSLRDYYQKQGYIRGDNLEVAIKYI